MKTINSKSPRIDPWGTPVEIEHESEATPFVCTCCETNCIRFVVDHKSIDYNKYSKRNQYTYSINRYELTYFELIAWVPFFQ